MTGRTWTVYILRCGDGSLYTGITRALQARFALHCRGKAAKYTRSRGPLALVWHRGQKTEGEARRIEYALKQSTRAEKLRLIAGDRALWRQIRDRTLPLGH